MSIDDDDKTTPKADEAPAPPSPPKKKPYHAPVLRHLGSVRETTNATFSADGNARRKPQG